MKKKLLTLGAIVAVAAGALATSAFALQGGAPDATHTYVGMMLTPDGELCSGSLVDPTTFVTAAHCIAQAGGEPVALSFAEFPTGPTAFGVAFRDPAFVQTPGGLSHSDLNDVAVVKIVSGPIAGPYAALPAVGYDDTLPNNQRIDNLGYGVQDAKTLSGAGFRQIVTEKIIPGGGASGANFLKISGGNTCFGDSGGPNLVGNTIVSINSYGPSASCNAVSYSQRLDTPQVHGFIASFLN